MSSRPLIIVTRPEPDAVRTAEFLEGRGLQCLVRPLIETRTITPSESDVRALLQCDWLLVTSRNGAAHLAAILPSSPEKEARKSLPSIAAIHDGSAAALTKAGISPERILHAPTAEAAGKALADNIDKRPLLIGYPCSERADTKWAAAFPRDIRIVPVPLYTTDAKEDASDESARAFWQDENFDYILVASPTAARALHALKSLDSFSARISFAAIGRTTAAALDTLGHPADIVPREPTLPALADALIHWRDARRRP